MHQDEPVSEQLQLLRAMESRSAVYQDLSGRFSLITGIVCLALGSWMSFKTRGLAISDWFHSSVWLTAWASWIIFSCFTLTVLVYRKAQSEQTPAITPGLKHALRGAAPSLLCSIILGSTLAWQSNNNLALCSALWIASYGCAILSTKLFASKSLRLLGLIELTLGISLGVLAIRHGGKVNNFHLANFYLCLGFGVIPIIYGMGTILLNKLEQS